jgi:hypothetical protein
VSQVGHAAERHSNIWLRMSRLTAEGALPLRPAVPPSPWSILYPLVSSWWWERSTSESIAYCSAAQTRLRWRATRYTTASTMMNSNNGWTVTPRTTAMR